MRAHRRSSFARKCSLSTPPCFFVCNFWKVWILVAQTPRIGVRREKLESVSDSANLISGSGSECQRFPWMFELFIHLSLSHFCCLANCRHWRVCQPSYGCLLCLSCPSLRVTISLTPKWRLKLHGLRGLPSMPSKVSGARWRVRTTTTSAEARFSSRASLSPAPFLAPVSRATSTCRILSIARTVATWLRRPSRACSDWGHIIYR